jgi:hypothetical protein
MGVAAEMASFATACGEIGIADNSATACGTNARTSGARVIADP